MGRFTWTSRLSAALLTLIVLAGFCDVGAACAVLQDTSGKCCCPVEGASPCLDSAQDPSDVMPESDATPTSFKVPSLEPPTVDPRPLLPVASDALPSRADLAAPSAPAAPVFLMCCVFLH